MEKISNIRAPALQAKKSLKAKDERLRDIDKRFQSLRYEKLKKIRKI